MTGRHASDSLRYWRNKAGLTPEALEYDLRLQDTRGTAATRLLNEGLNWRISPRTWAGRSATRQP
ncbi:hypothetical protein SAMN02746000_03851 [Paracoccus sp. J56]|nr:hypothetical protein SAMN02746000_03851 [Paracoccus sp. J56]